MSSCVFLIYAEGLSNVIEAASYNGEIHGCQISPTALIISHLLYADDSFLFFQGTTEEAMSVKRLLVNYEKWYGQSINFQKSGFFYSANISHDKQLEISYILEVHNDINNTK